MLLFEGVHGIRPFRSDTQDVMSNSPFLSQANRRQFWKENLVVNQTSLRAIWAIKMISAEHSSNKCKNKVTKKILIARKHFEYS